MSDWNMYILSTIPGTLSEGSNSNCIIYVLVQAKRPKLCQPRMPHAVATRKPIVLTAHEQRKRVAWLVFLLRSYSRADASGKNVSRPTTGLRKGLLVL